MESYNGNALYGKKWAACGDSEDPTGIIPLGTKLKQAVDYPTNTHPNDRAHEFESWFIEDFLRRI